MHTFPICRTFAALATTPATNEIAADARTAAFA